MYQGHPVNLIFDGETNQISRRNDRTVYDRIIDLQALSQNGHMQKFISLVYYMVRRKNNLALNNRYNYFDC